jgi:hypothetical protein
MKLKAEMRTRELLAEEGFAPPDRVEYGEACVRLFWDGPKIVIVVDVDDDGEIGLSRLGEPESG